MIYRDITGVKQNKMYSFPNQEEIFKIATSTLPIRELAKLFNRGRDTIKKIKKKYNATESNHI